MNYFRQHRLSSTAFLLSLSGTHLTLKTHKETEIATMSSSTENRTDTVTDDSPISVSFWQEFAFWLKLGFISFGGPAGQISIMHQELVENRRWISERRFLHALNYCMLLPGPEAQQLATYIGWLMHRTWGGIVAGGLFVLPSLLILIALSWVYIAFGEMPLVAGLLRDQTRRYRDSGAGSASYWFTSTEKQLVMGDRGSLVYSHLCGERTLSGDRGWCGSGGVCWR